MKAQVHVHKVEAIEVLAMETRSTFGSLHMALETKRQPSKLKHKNEPHYELDIDEYICVFNKLMVIGIDGQQSQISMASNYFKNTYVSKKMGFLAPC